MWTCEQADIENRKLVLTLLAGKTSHRDAYEILTNLPGIRQPISELLVIIISRCNILLFKSSRSVRFFFFFNASQGCI